MNELLLPGVHLPLGVRPDILLVQVRAFWGEAVDAEQATLACCERSPHLAKDRTDAQSGSCL